MPRLYHSSAAQCPYYRGEDINVASLCCAGIGQAETIRLFFRARHKAIEHREKYCRGNWEECVIAQIMEEEPE